MRAYVYTRQSLDKTGDGLAVARQLNDCRKLCESRGWDIVEHYSDNDMSGYSAKPRPGYQKLIAAMEAGRVDVVVCWAVDRLTRRLADLTTLIELCERTGVKVATVSGDLDLSTDTGRLVARILGSVAQGEVERKGTRQKAANRQARLSGKVATNCPRPFGWGADRRTPHPLEGPAVADAARAVLAGGTLAGVARKWGEMGLRPPQAPYGPLMSRPWRPHSVRSILMSPRVAGISTHKGTEVGRGDWQPLITEATYRAVVQMLSDPSRQRAKGVRSMLGGLARCWCGNKAIASASQGGPRVYRCFPPTRNEIPGRHVAVRADWVDEFVGELVIGRMQMDDAIDLLAPKADPERARALHEEGQAIRQRMKALGGMFVRGAITEQDVANGRAEGDRRLAEIAAELAEVGRENVLADLLAEPRKVWNGWGDDRRRAAVDTLMTVTLYPAGRGARTFDPAVVLPKGKGIVWKGGQA